MHAFNVYTAKGSASPLDSGDAVALLQLCVVVRERERDCRTHTHKLTVTLTHAQIALGSFWIRTKTLSAF